MPLVIGIGNQYRQDDGVGHFVIEQLRQRLGEDFTSSLQLNSGDMVALLDQWQQQATVILVDACQDPAQPPGIIFRLEMGQHNSGIPIPAESKLASSHGFSIPEAVALGETLQRMPDKLQVICINGESFDHGQTLTGSVKDACLKVVDELAAQLLETSDHA